MRRAKYGNVKTVVDGIQFDSKREASRYGELLLLFRAGKITQLTLQKKFDLLVDGVKIGKIILDFVYGLPDGTVVYEDVKSKPTITPLFKWKAKHFEAQYHQKVTLYL